MVNFNEKEEPFHPHKFVQLRWSPGCAIKVEFEQSPKEATEGAVPQKPAASESKQEVEPEVVSKGEEEEGHIRPKAEEPEEKEPEEKPAQEEEDEEEPAEEDDSASVGSNDFHIVADEAKEQRENVSPQWNLKKALEQLQEMGFSDDRANIEYLIKHRGDIKHVIRDLLGA